MLNRKIAIGVSVPVMALALSATASFANSNEGTVTADALNVRSGPSTSYSISSITPISVIIIICFFY